jgi:hypothetical protein
LINGKLVDGKKLDLRCCDVCNRGKIGTHEKKSNFQDGSIIDSQQKRLGGKILICVTIRSRLFPFSVTAILQITFPEMKRRETRNRAIKMR